MKELSMEQIVEFCPRYFFHIYIIAAALLK